VLVALLAWYAEPERASAARVFAFAIDDNASAEQIFASTRFSEFTEVLASWLQAPLPPMKGEDLLRAVADRLLAEATHPRGEHAGSQLFVLRGSPGELYLLRTEAELEGVRSYGFGALEKFSSPDTEAALAGIFRSDGCSELRRACEELCTMPHPARSVRAEVRPARGL
jgi:hypothetical protein